VNDLVGCRDLKLLCRRRGALDTRHSWKWLGEAERWKVLAHREIASRFQTNGSGSDGHGPTNDRRRLPKLVGREPSWALKLERFNLYLGLSGVPPTFLAHADEVIQ
jgi:hypothetical protein